MPRPDFMHATPALIVLAGFTAGAAAGGPCDTWESVAHPPPAFQVAPTRFEGVAFMDAGDIWAVGTYHHPTVAGDGLTGLVISDVDFNDLLAMLAAWGPCGACPADLDGSGTVDFSDLVLLLANWT